MILYGGALIAALLSKLYATRAVFLEFGTGLLETSTRIYISGWKRTALAYLLRNRIISLTCLRARNGERDGLALSILYCAPYTCKEVFKRFRPLNIAQKHNAFFLPPLNNLHFLAYKLLVAMPKRRVSAIEADYHLPSAIQSVRDGWQMTLQGAAIVSGLLAGVAAQLFSFFKSNQNYKQCSSGSNQSTDCTAGAQGFIVGCCYFTLIFNIIATVNGFVLIDGLGELQYHAASMPPSAQGGLPAAGMIQGSALDLLKRFGGGKYWRRMVWNWLFSFVVGILSLLVVVVAYIMTQESFAMKFIASILLAYAIIPGAAFVCTPRFRPVPNAPMPGQVSQGRTPSLESLVTSPGESPRTGTSYRGPSAA